MSKTLSLRLKESIYLETEKIIHRIKVPRNTYINTAISHFNELHKRKILKQKLEKESKLLSAESMKILKDLELLDSEI